VSRYTQEQNTDRQHMALKPFNIPPKNLYVDAHSGKDFNRPAYKKLLKRLNSGDLLIVKSIDRLGRNYGEIIEQWRVITQTKGAEVRVLDMPLLDTTYCKDLLGTFISDLVLQILSFAAQSERDNLLQRQTEGIAAAKSRGVVFGKKPLPLPANFAEIVTQWRRGGLTSCEVAAICGFSRRTLFYKTKAPR
jgi:DNA invertase Pin-like site-specific DNA recombinase